MCFYCEQTSNCENNSGRHGLMKKEKKWQEIVTDLKSNLNSTIFAAYK